MYLEYIIRKDKDQKLEMNGNINSQSVEGLWQPTTVVRNNHGFLFTSKVYKKQGFNHFIWK